MSDYNSSLPIRTENAGDAIVKVADATTPSQQLKVEADGSLNVNASITLPPGSEIKITDGTDTVEVNADGSINVVATATDLDIRDLSASQDNVAISDGTDTLAINADGSINISDNGGSITVDGSVTVSATNLDIRDLTSASDSVEVLQTTHDDLNANANIQVGDTDVSNSNPVPVSDAGGSLTVDAVNLDIRDLNSASDSVTVVATDLDVRDLTHVSDSVKVGDGTDLLAVNADGSLNITDNGGSLTVDAVNLDVRDLTHVSDSVKIGDGTDLLAVNSDGSINVKISDSSGSEVHNHDTQAALAAGSSDNHDYTSTGSFWVTQVEASASGKLKIELQKETGVATNTFTTIAVQFNSTSSANCSLPLKSPLNVANGVRVRVIRTNRDNQSQDVYSTIIGYTD